MEKIIFFEIKTSKTMRPKDAEKSVRSDIENSREVPSIQCYGRAREATG